MRHRFPHPAALALAAVGVAVTGCAQGEEGRESRAAERAPTAERQQAVPAGRPRDQGAGPSLRMELAAGVRLDPSAQAELAEAARRFATTLAGWLYGDRREIDVEPIAWQLRRELASALPYVPPEQVGSGDGRAVQAQVFLQTSRSGVLVVTMRDSRTSYPIPASFERRAGRWQVIHLSTH